MEAALAPDEFVTGSGAVTGGPGAILATKLRVPATPGRHVPRARLVGRLDEAVTRALTLVCAPAGFGKTSLLADWSRQFDGVTAWVALDPGDNDPVRFWRHVVAALEQARPGVADATSDLMASAHLCRAGLSSGEAVATAVVIAVAGWTGGRGATDPSDADPDSVVLVLDDYHLIDAHAVHASLLHLLEHLPVGLHVVLSTRADPPLPLARLRVRGQLAELRANELQLTDAETAELLGDVLGPEVAGRAELVTALTARTEGWAAGLQLAALSLDGEHDARGFVDTFSGSHRYVLDYLTDEVLARQPERVRRFLLDTSVLDRLTAELCDAVTGTTGSQEMLEHLEHANLFLVALDDVRGWWRYHHLFADVLRAVALRDPHRVTMMHRRAAAWHETRGSADSAVQHALSAGDAEWAARLVEVNFDAFYSAAEADTLHRWIAALPADLVNDRPRLILAQATLAMRGARPAGVDELLGVAEAAIAESADEPFEPTTVGAEASRLANLPAAITLGRSVAAHQRGDTTAARMLATDTLCATQPSETTLRGIAHTVLAAVDYLDGELAAADLALAQILAHDTTSDRHDLVALAGDYAGVVRHARGDQARVADLYQWMLERDPTPSAATGIAHVGLARVAYERDDLDAATAHATEGVAISRRYGHTQTMATGLTTLAWIRHATGDPRGAASAMDEAHDAADPSVIDVFNPVPASRARLLLAQGDLDAATAWTRTRGLTMFDEPSFAREPAQLVLARVLLAHGRVDEARDLLGRLHDHAVAQQRIGSLIEIQAVQALALATADMLDDAHTTLRHAVALAHPRGRRRVFIDEGTAMAELVATMIAARANEAPSGEAPSGDHVPLAELAQFTSRIDTRPVAAATTPVPVPVAQRLVVPLTTRELDVLALVADGRQNKEIAAELYLAVNTVKHHVTHILDKLGAANRTQAAARARELMLIG